MDRFSSIQANQQNCIASLILKDERQSPAYPMMNMTMNGKHHQQKLNDPSMFVKSNTEEITNDCFSNTEKYCFGNAYNDTSVQNRSGRGFGGNESYNNNIPLSHPPFYPANNRYASNTIPNASHNFPGVEGNTTSRSLPTHPLSGRGPVHGAGGRYNMSRNPSYVNNSRSDRCLMSSSSNDTSFPMPVNDGIGRRAYSDGYVHPSLLNDSGMDMPAIPAKRRSSTINMTAVAATVFAGERVSRRRNSKQSPGRSPTTIDTEAAVTTVTAGERTKMTKRRSSCRSMEAAAELVVAGERARSSIMCMKNAVATVAAAGDRTIMKRQSSSRNMAAAALLVAAEDRTSRRSPIISMTNKATVSAGEIQMRRNSNMSMAAVAVTVAAGERQRRRSSTRSMAAAVATVAAEEKGLRKSATRNMEAAAATVAAEERPTRRSSTRSMAAAAATVAVEEIPARRSCTISMASAAATIVAEERETRRSSTISMAAAAVVAEEEVAMTAPVFLRVGRQRFQARMMALSAMANGMAVAPPSTRRMSYVSTSSSVIPLASSTSSSSLCSMDNTVYDSLPETRTHFANKSPGNEEEDMRDTFEDDVNSFIAQTREKINIYDSSLDDNQTSAGILHGGVSNSIFGKEENTMIRKDSCCSIAPTGTVDMNYIDATDYEIALSKSTSLFRDMSCSSCPSFSDTSDATVNGSFSDNDDEEDNFLENSSLSMPQNFLMEQVAPTVITNKHNMRVRRHARVGCTRRRNRIPSYNNDSDDSDRAKSTSNSIRSDSSDKTEVTNNCRRNLSSPMRGKNRRRFRSFLRSRVRKTYAVGNPVGQKIDVN